jgi:hypothetical protein
MTKMAKPIEGLYEDKNRDGIINDNDKYWTKNSEAKAFMASQQALLIKGLAPVLCCVPV